jgi:acetyl-CoA carboxylase biotin carboxyl carrier protein
LAMDLPGSLRRLSVRSGDAAIDVEWQDSADHGVTAPATTKAPLGTAAPVDDDAAEADAGRKILTSPMVGTFYRARRPGEDPFVTVGDTVEEGQTVGVLEAMKLFNPIESECAGVVAEIYVDNAQPVEFGQPLMAFVVSQP